jgi:hypothetical protein
MSDCKYENKTPCNGFSFGILYGIFLTVVLTGQKAMADHLLPKFQYTKSSNGEWSII